MAVLGIGDGLVELYLSFEDGVNRSVAGVHAFTLQNPDTIEPIVTTTKWAMLLLELADALELLPESELSEVLEKLPEVVELATETVDAMIEDPTANDNVLSSVIGGPEVNIPPVEPPGAPTHPHDYSGVTAAIEATVEQSQSPGAIIGGPEVNGAPADSQTLSNDNVDHSAIELAGVLETADKFEAAYWERHAGDGEADKESARAQLEQARSDTIRQWEERQRTELELEPHDLT
jgi:hypothetical protein